MALEIAPLLLPAVYLCLLFALFMLALVSMSQFDELVCFEFQHHPQLWLSDGAPRGFFWSPHGMFSMRGRWAASWLLLKWLVQTPDWINKKPTLIRSLWLMRIGSLLGILVVLRFYWA